MCVHCASPLAVEQRVILIANLSTVLCIHDIPPPLYSSLAVEQQIIARYYLQTTISDDHYLVQKSVLQPRMGTILADVPTVLINHNDLSPAPTALPFFTAQQFRLALVLCLLPP